MAKFEELVANLESEDEDSVKESVAQLGDMGDSRAVPFLLKKLNTAKDEELVESILWTLSRIGSNGILIKLLGNPNKNIVLEALDALGRRMASESVDKVISFVKHPDSEIRAMGTWVLGKIHAEKAYDLLIDLLTTDEDASVRANAAWAIGKYEKAEAHSILDKALKEETDETVQYNLKEASSRLEELKEQSQVGIKLTVYECPNKEVDCTKKEIKTDLISDQFIKIEINSCERCPKAKICQVSLIKNI